MKKFLQNYTRVLLPFILLISFSLIGANCEDILQNNPIVTGDIVGDWQLVEQTGALQDICDDETVNFRSTGIAQLTCPNSASITRTFTIENDELTYTQTSISYRLEFSQDFQNLYLYGINVSRNLAYQKIITSYGPSLQPEKTVFNNSSEQQK